jgi:hypothetical protein
MVAAQLSPDSEWLVGLSGTGTLCWWDMRDGSQIMRREVELPSSETAADESSLHLSPGGKHLILTSPIVPSLVVVMDSK